MEKNKLKKESAFARFLESFGMLILILLVLSILGSTVVMLLSLFLFLIPNHKLRLNAFVGLIITNVICTFFLTFHPFDIVFLEEIIIWANTIDPEYNKMVVGNMSQGRLGLTDILSLYLFENGVIEGSKLGLFIVTDFICFILYFFIPYLLAPNE